MSANQRKVTVAVEVVPEATSGTFAPIDKSAKSAQLGIDELAKKVQAANRLDMRAPFTAAGGEAQKLTQRFVDVERALSRVGRGLDSVGSGGLDQLNRSAMTVSGNLDQATNRLQALGRTSPGDPLNRMDASAQAVASRFNDVGAAASQAGRNINAVGQTTNGLNRLGQTVAGVGRAFGGALSMTTQLASGIAMVTGSNGDLQQLLRTVSMFQGLHQIGNVVGSLGAGIGGVLARPAANAASSVTGQVAGGAAGGATVQAAGWGGSAVAVPAAVIGTLLAGVHSFATMGRDFGTAGPGFAPTTPLGVLARATNVNGDRYANWQVQNTGGIPGIGSLLGTSALPEQNDAMERQRRALEFYSRLRRTTGARRPDEEAAAAQEAALQQPGWQLRHSNAQLLAGLHGGIMGRVQGVDRVNQDRESDLRLERWQYADSRGQAPGATAAERLEGGLARRLREQELRTNIGADGASIQAATQAAHVRQQAGTAVREQEAVVANLERSGVAPLEQRRAAQQQLLDLQRQHLAAVQAEVGTQNQLRESEIQRLQSRQQLLQVDAQAARARADNFRDVTRQGSRQIAGMSEEEQQRTLALTRRVRAGEQLGNEDLQHLSGLGIAQDAVNAQLDRRSENNPIIAELLQNLGRPQEQQRRDAERNRAQEVAVQVQAQIDVRMDDHLREMTDSVNAQIAPAITGVADALGRAMQIETARMMADSLIRAFQQQNGDRNANAGGGVP